MTVIVLVLCYNNNTEGFTHLKGVERNDKESTGEDIQYYNT